MSLSSRVGVSSSVALGVIAVGWSAVVSIVSIRWYVGLLGIESYGLIGFFATLQAAIALFELGLGATINREVARSAALDDLDHARRLLYSLEFVYWGFSLVIVIVIGLAAPLISDYWLGTSKLPRDEIHWALCLMGVVAALRWPVGLYQGALVGLHRAQVSYRMSATIATVANVGAVLILMFAYQSLWAYFTWQAAAALLYVVWARRSGWRALGGKSAAGFDPALLKSVLVQSAMMSGVAMSGLILTQLDKFVVSSSTSLADFGRYALAGVLASGLSVLFIPTFNVIYPRLSALFATGSEAEQVGFYRLGTRLFLSCLFPIALSAYFYAYDLLALWTGDPVLAASTAPVAGLLFLGSALNGTMHFPYAIQLATGRTRLPFFINCTLIAIMLPLAIALVGRYGAWGGGAAWLLLNAIYFVIGVTVTHHYILPGLQARWLLRDVAPALVASAAIVSAGHYVAGQVDLGHLVRLAIATVISLVATATLALGYRDVRTLVRLGWAAARARIRRLPVGSLPC